MTDPRDPLLDDAYRESARDEPPRSLDARILARARESVAPREEAPSEMWPLRRPQHWLMRWRVPLAVAATLLVSATITLMIQDTGVDVVLEDAPPDDRFPPPRVTERRADRGGETAGPLTKPMPAEAGRSAEVPIPAAEAIPKVPEPPFVMMRGADELRPPPASAKRETAPAGPELQAGAVPAPSRAVVPPGSRSESFSAPGSQAESTLSMRDDAATRERERRESAGNDLEQSRRSLDVTSSAKAPTPLTKAESPEVGGTVSALPAPPTSAFPETPAERATVQLQRAPSAELPRGSAAAPPLAAAPPAPAAAEPIPAAPGHGLATPEAFVERIRELRRAGRETEARELLEELVRKYPAFPLPDDLRARR